MILKWCGRMDHVGDERLTKRVHVLEANREQKKQRLVFGWMILWGH